MTRERRSLEPLDPEAVHEMRAEVETFDADGYTVDQRGPEEYVATFPKK